MKSRVPPPRTPATLYAGTDAGVFKSIDAAHLWAPANTGLIQPPPPGVRNGVAALAIDPAKPAVLYAGTGSGVFKSTDSAGTWALVYPNPILIGSASVLAIDPTNHATLYAGMDGGSPSFYSTSSLVKSTDAGSTWTTVYVSPASVAWISAVVVDPANPATLYVGMPGGVVKSTDGGGAWAPVNAGVAGGSTVRALAIDPTAPSTVYRGGGGLWKSTDSGATWVRVCSTDVTVLSIQALATWTAVNAGLTSPCVDSLAIDPASPATL